jgi:DNA-binding transcriptional regulator LsrR (DeoR family)
MKSQLPGAVSSLPQAEIARRLGKTEEAVKAEASRFRRRFRDLVRVEIHHTVAGVPEIDEELRYLSEVLRDMVG